MVAANTNASSLNVLSGSGAREGSPPRLTEPLSESEIRVLRYLPTKLSAPEIADELYLSVNTVKTHMRHLYDKLGVHRRHEAVEQARALGLLAPSPRKP
jgi:LuxR family transcriptional regulator, maltose regulon positive regulatory protein